MTTTDKQILTQALTNLRKAHAANEATNKLLEATIDSLQGVGKEPASEEFLANVAAFPYAEFGRKKDGTPRLVSGRQALKLKRLAE